MADPKLKEAAAEIKGILMKHDIGGYVMLVSKTHSEYMFRLDTKWSGIKNVDNQFSIEIKKANYKTIELFRETKALTQHLIHQIRDLSALGFSHMERLIAQVSEHIPVDHESFKDHEPHREQ